MPTSLTIETASVCEYFPSGPLSLARQRSARANFVITIDGRMQAGPAVGVGECTIWTSSADERAQAMYFVQDALDHLIGSTQSLDDAPWDLADRLGPLVKGLRLGRPQGLTPVNRRRCIYGLESALLELLASIRPVTTQAQHSVHIARMADAASTASLGPGSPPAVFLRSTGDLDHDHRALDRTGPGHGTYILEVPYAVPDEALDHYVESIASLLVQRPGARIVLDAQTRVTDLDRVEELQGAADSAVVSRLGNRAGELLIMAGYGIRTPERLERLLTRNIRALHLRSAQVGSLLQLHALANRARAGKPDLYIAVSAPRGGSRLSDLTCQRLTALTPAVDAFVPGLDSVEAAVTFDSDPEATPDGGLPAPAKVRFDELIPIAGSYTYLSEKATADAEPHVYAAEADSLGLSHDALRSSLVQRSALAHGFHTTRYSTTTFTADQGSDPSLLFGASARSPVSSHTAYVISDGHKGAAQALLERAGAPVPEGRIFAIADETGALAYAHAAGFPLVAKPASGTGGTGVTLNIQDDAQLLSAFETIRTYPRYAHGDVLIQRHMPGDIYRIVVGDGRVLAAIRRRRPLVVGDGRRSIAELIIATNSPRRLNPRLRNAPITIEASAAFLEQQGRTVRDIPRAGESVYLGTNADGAMWGDSFDVSGDLHPTIAAAMVSAVAAIPGLRFCGVDVLIEDHRRPLHDQQVGICELNSCPELTTPEFPVYGAGSASANVLFQGAAQRYGLSTGRASAEPRVRLVAARVSDSERFSRWLKDQAAARSIQLSLVDQTEHQVEAQLSGSLVAVTSLCSLAIKGPQGTAVGRIETFPIPDTEATSVKARP